VEMASTVSLSHVPQPFGVGDIPFAIESEVMARDSTRVA
jgi:hypothetical protein